MLESLVLVSFLAAPASAGAGFDHAGWDGLLRRHVVGGMVDYDAFVAAPEFPKYLDDLARADLARLDDRERLAFWINVYNAYTIELINRHAERESIRNINRSLGLALKGPWREKLVRAGGQVLHLDHVEHEIVRKQWREPRIHFALVCAAMSCPPLRAEAYTGARLDQQLDDQARRFLLQTPQANRVDVEAATVHGSPIYTSWYRDDFGATDAAIGRFLAGFRPEGPERQLLLSGRFRLVETPYDWTLNSQEQARRLAARRRTP